MPVDEHARTAAHLVATPETAQQFRSLRWRILTPLLAALMVALMISVYGISYTFLKEERDQSTEQLLDESANVAVGALEVGRGHRAEAQRIAYTSGVISAIQQNNPVMLRDVVEPLAALANLDLVIIGADSREILGLQRRVMSGEAQYVTATDSNLWDIDAVQRVQTGAESASSLLMVERRPMLVTALPVMSESGEQVGIVLVGQDITRILRDLKPDNDVELALFAEENLFGATFPGATAPTTSGK